MVVLVQLWQLMKSGYSSAANQIYNNNACRYPSLITEAGIRRGQTGRSVIINDKKSEGMATSSDGSEEYRIDGRSVYTPRT